MSTSATSITSPQYFTGVSKFSTDLQSVLSRAVQIANLPLTQIQNQQSDIISKKQLLTNLGTQVGTLAGTIASLGSIGDDQGLTVTSSNSAVVQASTLGAASPGIHTFTNISSLASAASETSLTGFATADTTAVSSGASLQLAIGSKTYSIDTSSGAKNNLNAIAQSINNLNAGVSATVLNTGTGATPYYLSLTSAASGSTTLELRQTPGDSASTILTKTNQGSDVDFYLDGLHVVKHDNVISDVIPGLTFTVQQKISGSTSVTLSLSSQRSGLANALNELVTNYNDTVKQINAQVGQSAGLLSGDFIVREVRNKLQQLTGFSDYGSSGTVQSLTDLGIELDKTGTMSFNSDKFYALSNSDLASAFTFLKSDTGLGQFAGQLQSITDPVTGLIKLQQDQYDATDKRLSDQASALQTRISTMQASLLSQLQAADSLLASLESQQNLLNASIDSLNYAVYGRITSNSSSSSSGG